MADNQISSSYDGIHMPYSTEAEDVYKRQAYAVDEVLHFLFG